MISSGLVSHRACYTPGYLAKLSPTYRLHLLTCYIRLEVPFGPSSRPTRPHSLIKRYTNSVLGVDLSIEGCLEIPMSSKTFFDEPAPSPLRPQLQCLEPIDVFFVEEHIAYSDELLVNLIGVSG